MYVFSWEKKILYIYKEIQSQLKEKLKTGNKKDPKNVSEGSTLNIVPH